jgi:hypothetical protein
MVYVEEIHLTGMFGLIITILLEDIMRGVPVEDNIHMGVQVGGGEWSRSEMGASLSTASSHYNFDD